MERWVGTVFAETGLAGYVSWGRTGRIASEGGSEVQERCVRLFVMVASPGGGGRGPEDRDLQRGGGSRYIRDQDRDSTYNTAPTSLGIDTGKAEI